jgi:hypothetical protein
MGHYTKQAGGVGHKFADASEFGACNHTAFQNNSQEIGHFICRKVYCCISSRLQHLGNNRDLFIPFDFWVQVI